jgi:hypothetical protein
LIPQPVPLFLGLPAVEPFSPRVTLLGAFYPYGVSATVSGSKWMPVRSTPSPPVTAHHRVEHGAALQQCGHRRGGRRRSAARVAQF